MSQVLWIDDKWVGELHVTKVLVPCRSEQRLVLWAQVRPVADREEWRELSEQRRSTRITYAGRPAMAVIDAFPGRAQLRSCRYPHHNRRVT